MSDPVPDSPSDSRSDSGSDDEGPSAPFLPIAPPAAAPEPAPAAAPELDPQEQRSLQYVQKREDYQGDLLSDDSSDPDSPQSPVQPPAAAPEAAPETAPADAAPPAAAEKQPKGKGRKGKNPAQPKPLSKQRQQWLEQGILEQKRASQAAAQQRSRDKKKVEKEELERLAAEQKKKDEADREAEDKRQNPEKWAEKEAREAFDAIYKEFDGKSLQWRTAHNDRYRAAEEALHRAQEALADREERDRMHNEYVERMNEELFGEEDEDPEVPELAAQEEETLLDNVSEAGEEEGGEVEVKEEPEVEVPEEPQVQEEEQEAEEEELKEEEEPQELAEAWQSRLPEEEDDPCDVEDTEIFRLMLAIISKMRKVQFLTDPVDFAQFETRKEMIMNAMDPQGNRFVKRVVETVVTNERGNQVTQRRKKAPLRLEEYDTLFGDGKEGKKAVIKKEFPHETISGKYVYKHIKDLILKLLTAEQNARAEMLDLVSTGKAGSVQPDSDLDQAIKKSQKDIRSHDAQFDKFNEQWNKVLETYKSARAEKEEQLSSKQAELDEADQGGSTALFQVLEGQLNQMRKTFTEWKRLQKELLKQWSDAWQKWKVDQDRLRALRSQLANPDIKGFTKSAAYVAFEKVARMIEDVLQTRRFSSGEDAIVSAKGGAREQLIALHKKLMEALDSVCRVLAKKRKGEELTESDCEDVEAVKELLDQITQDTIEAAWKKYQEYRSKLRNLKSEAKKAYETAQVKKNEEYYEDPAETIELRYPGAWLFKTQHPTEDPTDDQKLWDLYIAALLESKRLQRIPLTLTEENNIVLGPDADAARVDGFKISRTKQGNIKWCMRPGVNLEHDETRMKALVPGTDGMIVFNNTPRLLTLVQEDNKRGLKVDWFQPIYEEVGEKAPRVPNALYYGPVLSGKESTQQGYVEIDYGIWEKELTLKGAQTARKKKKGEARDANTTAAQFTVSINRAAYFRYTEAFGRQTAPSSTMKKRKADDAGPSGKSRKRAEPGSKVKTGHLTMVSIRLNSNHKLWWISGRLKNNQMFDVPTLMAKKLGMQEKDGRAMMRGIGDAHGSDALTPLLTTGDMNLVMNDNPGKKTHSAYDKPDASFDYSSLETPQEVRKKACDLTHLDEDKNPDFRGRGLLRVSAIVNATSRLKEIAVADIRQEAVRCKPADNLSQQELDNHTQYSRLFRSIFWKPRPFESFETFPPAAVTEVFSRCEADGMAYAMAFSQVSAASTNGQPTDTQEYFPEVCMFKEATNEKVANDNVEKNGAENFIRLVRPTAHNKKGQEVPSFDEKTPPEGTKQWIAYQNAKWPENADNEYRDHSWYVSELEAILNYKREYEVVTEALKNPAVKTTAQKNAAKLIANRDRWDQAGKIIYENCLHLAPQNLEQAMMRYLVTFIPRETFPARRGDDPDPKWLKNILFKKGGLYVEFYGDTGKNEGEGGVDTFEPIGRFTTLADLCNKDGLNLRDFGEIWAEVDDAHWNAKRVGLPHWFRKEQQRSTGINPQDLAKLNATFVNAGRDVTIASETRVNYNWNTVEPDPATNIADFLNKGVPPKDSAPHVYEHGKLQLFPPCRLNRLTRDAANFRLFKATRPPKDPDCPLRNEKGEVMDEKSEAAKWERAGRDDWYGPIYFVALDYDDVYEAMVSTEADWAVFMSQNNRTNFIKYSAQWLLLNADEGNSYLAINPRYESEISVGDGTTTGDKPEDKLVADIVKEIVRLEGVDTERANEILKLCIRPIECPRAWWWNLRKQHGQVAKPGEGVSETFKRHVDIWMSLFENRSDTMQEDRELQNINNALKDTFAIMRRHTLLLNWIVANPTLFGNGIASGSRDNDPLGSQGVFMLQLPTQPDAQEGAITDQQAQGLKQKWYALAMHNDVLEVANSLLMQVTRTKIKRQEVALRYCYGSAVTYKKVTKGGTDKDEDDLYPFVTKVVDTDGKSDDLPSVPNIEALVDILFSQMKMYLADERNVGEDGGKFERLCNDFHRLLPHTTPKHVSLGSEEPGMQQQIQGLCQHIKNALSTILRTVDDAAIQEAWAKYRGRNSTQRMGEDIMLWYSEDISKCLILQAASFVCHMEYSSTHGMALSRERRLSWVSIAMYIFTKTLLKAWWLSALPVFEDDSLDLAGMAANVKMSHLQFLDQPRIGLDGIVNVTDYDAMNQVFGDTGPRQRYPLHKAQWEYVAFMSKFVQNTPAPAEARIVAERQSITSAIAVTIFSNFFSMFDQKLTAPIQDAWKLWREAKSHFIDDPQYPFHPTRTVDVQGILQRLKDALVAHVNNTAVGTTKEMLEIQEEIKKLKEQVDSDFVRYAPNNNQRIKGLEADLEAKKRQLIKDTEDQRQDLRGLVALDFDENYQNLASVLEKINILSSEMQDVLEHQRKRNRNGSMVMDERTTAQVESRALKRLRTNLERAGQLRANLYEQYRQEGLSRATLSDGQKRKLDLYDHAFEEYAATAKRMTKSKEDDDEQEEDGTKAFMGQESTLALPPSCPPSPPSPPSGPVPIGYGGTSEVSRLEKLRSCIDASKESTNEWVALKMAHECEMIDLNRAMTERLQELTETISDLSEELKKIRIADRYVEQLADYVYQVYRVMRDAQTPTHTIDSLQKIADGITMEDVSKNIEDSDTNDMRNAFGTNSDSGHYQHDLNVWDNGRELFGIKGAYMDYFMSHFDFVIPTSGELYVRVLGVPLSPQQWYDRLSSHTVLRRPPQEFGSNHTREMQASIEKLRIIDPSDIHQHAAIVRDAAYSRFSGEPNVERFYAGIDNAIATSSLNILGQFRVFYEQVLKYKEDTPT